jgi:hypothetical protein
VSTHELSEQAITRAGANASLAAVNGIIQGALPPAALAVLFMLLPIILRRE